MNRIRIVAAVLLAGGLTLGTVAFGLLPTGTAPSGAEPTDAELPTSEPLGDPAAREPVPADVSEAARRGEVRLHDPAVRWVDIAQEATPNASGYVNLSLSWPETDEADGQQFWMCSYRGWNWQALKSEEWKDFPAEGGCIRRIGDDRLDVRVHGAGQGASQSAVNPYWVVDDRRWRVELSIPLVNWSHIENGSVVTAHNISRDDRPVMHIMAAWGGSPFDRTHVNVTWRGTEANVTHGGIGDVFTYESRDFDSSAYAQADGPYATGLVAHSDATLETSIVRSRSFTAFWFLTSQKESLGTDDDAPGWYERPDGTEGRHPFGWGFLSEVTTMPGPWRFHVGTSYQTLNHVPVLVGADYERARLPWETWTVPAS